MRYPDVDRLLREERFDELVRLGVLPRGSQPSRKSALERLVDRARLVLTPARRAEPGTLTIRHAGPADRAAVERLAEMEERAAPSGTLLVAEVEQEILAALPLDGGAPVAHPLRPTAGLIDLLELRSRQLERDEAAAA